MILKYILLKDREKRHKVGYMKIKCNCGNKIEIEKIKKNEPIKVFCYGLKRVPDSKGTKACIRSIPSLSCAPLENVIELGSVKKGA